MQIEDKKLKGKLRYTERVVADAQQAAAKVGGAAVSWPGSCVSLPALSTLAECRARQSGILTQLLTL